MTIVRPALLAFVCAVSLSLGAAAQTPAPAPAPPASKPAATKLQTFPTPEAAADALTAALRKEDTKEDDAILGMDWRDIALGSPEEENDIRDKYLAAWDKQHKIVMKDDKTAMIEVGTTGFLMAIPIVKEGDSWHFDVEAGQEEVLARFIGRNEYRTIQSLLALVDAEREYAASDPMKTGMEVYARRLLSTPGKKDGLYWETKPGEPESPLGPLLAKAQTDVKEGEGYYGYRYRLLYRQGPDAPGGAYEYIVNGRMIGGFAAIAWPVEYRETGVMTFIVSQSGDVYEQDLGEDTARRAAAINSFDPGKGWEKSDMTPPEEPESK